MNPSIERTCEALRYGFPKGSPFGGFQGGALKKIISALIGLQTLSMQPEILQMGSERCGADAFDRERMMAIEGDHRVIANLRGHIEAKGGHILAMTALTETGGGRQIAIRSEALSLLSSKHGMQLDQFWRAVFGYGIHCLTNIEAGYLYRVESFDTIRTRLAQAAERARRRGVSAVDV